MNVGWVGAHSFIHSRFLSRHDDFMIYWVMLRGDFLYDGMGNFTALHDFLFPTRSDTRIFSVSYLLFLFLYSSFLFLNWIVRLSTGTAYPRSFILVLVGRAEY